MFSFYMQNTCILNYHNCTLFLTRQGQGQVCILKKIDNMQPKKTGSNVE
jgi:hypothetical protein